MKPFYYILLGAVAVIAGSCDQQDEPVAAKASISFSIIEKVAGNGRTETPSAVIVSVKTASGAGIFEDKRLALLAFGQGYTTESIELPAGAYSLTKFLVINADNKVIYATPVESSPRAVDVLDPLPINFSVTASVTTTISPEVLSVQVGDTPTVFGYANFGFSIVDPATTKLKVKLQLLVGDILYQDVNSTLLVQGYDSLNAVKWSQPFSYVGPNENELALKSGYHHYTLDLNQWGVHDKLTISRQTLISSRADGPSPVTYVLGGAVAPKKIAGYVSYTQSTLDGSTILRPDYKVEYEYGSNNRVSKMTVLNYLPEKQSFEPLRYFDFSYDGLRVSKISGYLMPGNTFYTEDVYSYDQASNVSSIVERNFGTGVNGEVRFSYLPADTKVRAEYSFSNGTGFSYEFDYTGKNIRRDLTTRAGSTCSDGTYTYDKNINPLKHLGYVDFMLRDYSINNRLTENVNYVACAFPSLILESVAYEYDGEGYPTSSTKFYKPNSAGGQAITHIKYFYE